MNYPELTARLCAIIDQQNEIIEDQAMALAQHDAMARAEEIADLRREYEDAVGAPREVTAE